MKDVLLVLSAVLIVFAIRFVSENWYRLKPGYEWRTLQVRCDEQKGILIGKTCVKRDAVLWTETKL